ncbi:MAG TPA: polyprenyl synthetase family protein [Ktedonobacteraceae bacterium]|nr:polyprenyl synthetase family protein [Ktedonobacteraceae bacterium]
MSDDTQLPVSPFAARQQVLRERLHLLISMLHPALRVDVERAFAERGKLLFQSPNDSSDTDAGNPPGSWPLLTMLVAQHFSPGIDTTLAASVAIATECFVCALDLLDDVEDEDRTAVIGELGAARALNVSTTLLALAQRAILSLTLLHIDAQLILRLLDTLQESTLVATAGQHRDLLAERREASDLTREECVEIAAAKAGAIMRLACLSGAICAGATEAERAEFAEIGELLGIAHQLDNDSHDLYYLLQSVDTSSGMPAEGSAKTDLARGKKTLPVVLASSMSTPLQERRELSDGEKQEYRRALDEGIMTTWGISLLYRERAYDLLRAISLRSPLAPELSLLLGFK